MAPKKKESAARGSAAATETTPADAFGAAATDVVFLDCVRLGVLTEGDTRLKLDDAPAKHALARELLAKALDSKTPNTLALLNCLTKLLWLLSTFAGPRASVLAAGPVSSWPSLLLIRDLFKAVSGGLEDKFPGETVLSKGGWLACLTIGGVLDELREEDMGDEAALPVARFLLDFLTKECGVTDIFGVLEPSRLDRVAKFDTKMTTSLLSVAAAYGSLPLLELFLSMGADPNNRWEACGRTRPLLLAYMSGSMDCFDRLLLAGARIVAPKEVEAAWPIPHPCYHNKYKDCRKLTLQWFVRGYKDPQLGGLGRPTGPDTAKKTQKEPLPASAELMATRLAMIRALLTLMPELAREEVTSPVVQKGENEPSHAFCVSLLHHILTKLPEEIPLLKLVLDSGAEFLMHDDMTNPFVTRAGTLSLVLRDLAVPAQIELLAQRGLFKSFIAAMVDSVDLGDYMSMFTATVLKALKARDHNSLRSAEIIFKEGLTKVIHWNGKANVLIDNTVIFSDAPEADRLRALKYFKSHGLEVKEYSSKDKGGANLLHVAAALGLCEVARYAIEVLGCKVDEATTGPINILDEVFEPGSPLSLALTSGQSWLALQLAQDHGACGYIEGLPGKLQPLMQIFNSGSLVADERAASLVRTLLHNQPSLLEHDCFYDFDWDNTSVLQCSQPLFSAALGSFARTFEVLLNSGSKRALASVRKVFVLRGMFNTIAHVAAATGKWAAVASLVAQGAVPVSKVVPFPPGRIGFAVNSLMELAEKAPVPRTVMAALRAAALKEKKAEDSVPSWSVSPWPPSSAETESASAPAPPAAAGFASNAFEDPSYSAVPTDKKKAKRKDKKKKSRAKKRAAQAAAGAGASRAEQDSSDDDAAEDGEDDFGRYAPDVTGLIEQMRLQHTGDSESPAGTT